MVTCEICDQPYEYVMGAANNRSMHEVICLECTLNEKRLSKCRVCRENKIDMHTASRRWDYIYTCEDCDG
jgi:hypothetical protein